MLILNTFNNDILLKINTLWEYSGAIAYCVDDFNTEMQRRHSVR